MQLAGEISCQNTAFHRQNRDRWGIEFLDLSLEIPPELKELEVLWTTLTLDLRSRKYPLPQHSPDLELLMENLGSVETTLFTGRLLSHEHDYFLS